jgi:hypothetical protein
MRKQTRKGALLLALALTFAAAGSAAAAAQEGEPAPRPQAPPRQEVNHEVLVQLLVTAEGGEGVARVPQSLDGVLRQLKAALPQSDYRLAATYVHRVRDGGMFEVRGPGGVPFAPPQAANTLTPSFFQLSVTGVKLLDAAAAQPSINIQQFRLGMKVPIQTGATAGVGDRGAGYPVIQYEDTGLSTQLSVREGEPTLVGTLNGSRPGQLFVIIITVRRTR